MTTSKLTIREAKIRDGCWRRELEKAVTQQMRFMKDCCAARFAISYCTTRPRRSLPATKRPFRPLRAIAKSGDNTATGSSPLAARAGDLIAGP